MSRRKKIWSFLIAVMALNFIPVIASGSDKKEEMKLLKKTAFEDSSESFTHKVNDAFEWMHEYCQKEESCDKGDKNQIKAILQEIKAQAQRIYDTQATIDDFEEIRSAISLVKDFDTKKEFKVKSAFDLLGTARNILDINHIKHDIKSAKTSSEIFKPLSALATWSDAHCKKDEKKCSKNDFNLLKEAANQLRDKAKELEAGASKNELPKLKTLQAQLPDTWGDPLTQDNIHIRLEETQKLWSIDQLHESVTDLKKKNAKGLYENFSELAKWASTYCSENSKKNCKDDDLTKIKGVIKAIKIKAESITAGKSEKDKIKVLKELDVEDFDAKNVLSELNAVKEKLGIQSDKKKDTVKNDDDDEDSNTGKNRKDKGKDSKKSKEEKKKEESLKATLIKKYGKKKGEEAFKSALKKIKKLEGDEEDDDKVEVPENNLSEKDLSKAFFRFSASLKNDKVTLSGTLFEDCFSWAEGADGKPVWEITQHKELEGASCKNAVAFSITDSDGAGRKCMAEAKKKKWTCSSEHPCVRVSTMKDAVMDLSDIKKSVTAKLVFEDASGDGEEQQVCQDLPSDGSLERKTATEVALEKKAAAEAKKKKEIEQLTRTFRTCRHSEEELLLARDAIERLRDMNAIDYEMHGRKEKEIQSALFKMMMSRAMKAPIDTLEEFREQIISWASSHPQDTEEVVKALRNIAQRYVQQRNANSEAWDKARETLHEALGLSELKQSTKESLENELLEVKIGTVSSLAYSDDQFTFQSEYKSLKKEVEEYYLETIRNSSANEGQRMHAVKVMRATINLPGFAQRIRAEKAQQEAQLQQMLNGGGMYGNGMSGQGMFGPMYNPANLYNGGGMYGSMGGLGMHGTHNPMGMYNPMGMGMGMGMYNPMMSMMGMNNPMGMFSPMGMGMGMHNPMGMGMGMYNPMGMGMGMYNPMSMMGMNNPMGMFNPMGMGMYGRGW